MNFIDLQAQRARIAPEIDAAIARVLSTCGFIMGPEVTGFEKALGAFAGAKHVLSCANGTDALLLPLRAWEIGPGDAVFCPSFTFVATAEVVPLVGASPVFVDIDPVTYNIDACQLEAAITPRTRAILPVHLFGLCADMAPIAATAARARIPIVEDAAQAIGATFRGQPAGGMGALGCFSFFPSKNLGAFGDAGLVTTNDPALAHRVRLLRNHGAEPKYYHHIVGGNFRMDALQAAVLRVKAPHLAAWTEARRVNASRYARLFRQSGLDGRVTLPTEPPGHRHIYNQFVIRTADRDRLKRHLDGRGIGNEIYYPVPFHLQPCFADLGHRRGDFPHAERAADESLAIPIYSELNESQQAAVVDAIAEFAQVTA